MSVSTSGGLNQQVKVITDVKNLGELLAGARVDEVKLVTTQAGLQAVVELTRAMHERQATVKAAFGKRVKLPWTRSELTLSHVHGSTIKRLEDGIDQQPLLNCEAVPGGYEFVIQSPDGLRVALSLHQLDGAFRDVGAPIESP